MAKGRQVKDTPQNRIKNMQAVIPTEPKPKLLWVGDAVAHTGFSMVTDNILNRLVRQWDVSVIGVNYYGDPHDKPYKVYPASLGGDIYGINRLESIILSVKPDVVCFLNDPWIIQQYVPVIKKFSDVAKFAYIPVDSPNINPAFVQDYDVFHTVIAYTEFGKEELTRAGVSVPIEVIYHGVERDIFYPVEQKEARKTIGIPEDWFIVGCVARNQPRKRLDLLFQAFALFANDKPDNVKLYYHGALNDVGYDLVQLAQYFDIEKRLIITSKHITAYQGVQREVMRYVYNSFDVFASTTLGEGHGLTHSEAAACGIPQVVPYWSALAEWLTKGAIRVPCSSIMVNTSGVNTIGGVVDIPQFVEALELLYTDSHYRQKLKSEALQLIASDPKFSWDVAADRFHALFSQGKARNNEYPN